MDLNMDASTTTRSRIRTGQRTLAPGASKGNCPVHIELKMRVRTWTAFIYRPLIPLIYRAISSVSTETLRESTVTLIYCLFNFRRTLSVC